MLNNYRRTANKRIKSDWASLNIGHDGSVLVSVSPNGASRCIHFESQEQFKHALESKALLVKRWCVCVPRRSCIIKPLNLPASGLDEAARMVEFELPSLLPIPQDQLVYGCTQLAVHDNMTDVLVCVVKTDKLNSYLERYRSAGIEPRRVLLSSLAVHNWCAAVIDDMDSRPVIIALIGNSKCEVLTCINGIFQKANELSFPHNDITAHVQQATGEILHQRQELPDELPQDAVVVLGGLSKYVSEVKNQLSLVRDDHEVSEIRIIRTPQIAPYYDSPQGSFDGDGYCCDAIVTAGLLDLAVNSKCPHFNLLPQESLRRYARKAQITNYIVTGALAASCIALLWMYLLAMNWRTERACRQINSQIAPIKHIADAVETKRRQIKAIQDQVLHRGLITRIIEDLYRHTPKSISLSELTYISQHNGASVQLKGQADVLSNAFGYTEAMNDAALLNAVQIENAQQVARPGGSVVEFSADCIVKSE